MRLGAKLRLDICCPRQGYGNQLTLCWNNLECRNLMCLFLSVFFIAWGVPQITGPGGYSLEGIEQTNLSVHVCPFQVVWAAWVPQGHELSPPLRRRPGQCAGTSGAKEFLNPLYGEPFFSRRFPLLVDYCRAFQNPLYSLNFCSVLSVSLAGSLGCWCPHLLIVRAWKLLGSSFGVYGRRRLSVLCRPVAVRRGCLLIAALTGDAFSLQGTIPRESLYLMFRAAL